LISRTASNARRGEAGSSAAIFCMATTASSFSPTSRHSSIRSFTDDACFSVACQSTSSIGWKSWAAGTASAGQPPWIRANSRLARARWPVRRRAPAT
jgi:hypothetical protein